MLIEPCKCRESRETAMACAREPRGSLVWTSTEVVNGADVGPAEVVLLDGRREVFSPDSEWTHYSEGLARDWARVLHLDFETANA